MKMFLSFFALLAVISSNAFAANCPNLSGKFYDEFGFYNILVQEGCEKLTWTIDNNPATPDFEIGLPKTHVYIADGKDQVRMDGSHEVVYYAYFTKDALIVSHRNSFWHNGEWRSNYAREILSIETGAKPVITQLEKDLVDEEEFRSTNVDRSFHRRWLYKTTQL